MFFKFRSYFKMLVDRSILFLMGFLILVVYLTLFSSPELSEYNIGVILALFVPLTWVGIFVRIFSQDYTYEFYELVITYKEPLGKTFAYRYALSIILGFITLLISLLPLCFNPGLWKYNLLPSMLDSLHASFFMANFSLMITILSKRLDIGALGGIIVFLVIIRVPLSSVIYSLVFPAMGFVCGIIALILYSRG